MSLFIDTLTDSDGLEYEYGHCYQDYDDGSEPTGCGMEYRYYGDIREMESWHDAVGLVTRHYNVTREDRDTLEALHDSQCHTRTD